MAEKTDLAGSGTEQHREVSASSAGGREKPVKPKRDRKEKGKAASGPAGGGSKRSKKSRKDTPQPLTRVVIRRLPPMMTEELFREQISMDGEMPKHDEFYFVGPDWTLGLNASCRAYLNFTQPEDVFRFTDSFDGYTFVDSKGMEHQAIVEYAPFQKLPKNRSRKNDIKCNTIESDTHFMAFKEAAEAEEQEAQHGRGTQEFSFKIEKDEKITSTPLLEFIAQKKQEKRDERRRKQEEKRKARDEERHMKKTQIAKAIPESIKEETEITEILVRNVPSRLGGGQQSKAPGAGTDKRGGDGKAKDDRDKDKKGRNRKEKEGKQRDRKGSEDSKAHEGDGDRNAGRKQERDKGGKMKQPSRDKDKPRDDAKGSQQQQQQKAERNEKSKKVKEPNCQVNQSGDQVDGSGRKDSGKKYSERRKETRARAETRLAEQDHRKDDTVDAKDGKEAPKLSILTADVAPFVPKVSSRPSSSVHASASLPPSVGSLRHDVPSPISEETTTDNGKSPSPGDTGERKAVKPDREPRKAKEGREARKIRNKDRPSIEIYQPRKRIVAGGGKSEDDRGRSDSDRPVDMVAVVAQERRHKLTKKASDRQQRDQRVRPLKESNETTNNGTEE